MTAALATTIKKQNFWTAQGQPDRPGVDQRPDFGGIGRWIYRGALNPQHQSEVTER